MTLKELIAGTSLTSLAAVAMLAFAPAAVADMPEAVAADPAATVEPVAVIGWVDDGATVDGLSEEEWSPEEYVEDTIAYEEGEEIDPDWVKRDEATIDFLVDGEVVMYDDGDSACGGCEYETVAITSAPVGTMAPGRPSDDNDPFAPMVRRGDNMCNYDAFDIAFICDPWRAANN